MAKRVKALNDRREQLKAGITASTNKRRAKLGQSTETADFLRSFLQSLQVLQDTQLKQAQIKLAQAGIRSKDWALAVIFGRHGAADRASAARWWSASTCSAGSATGRRSRSSRSSPAR